MDKSKPTSMQARRDRTGGVVRDKLDILMAEIRSEAVPPHLLKLAEGLQSALDERQVTGEASS